MLKKNINFIIGKFAGYLGLNSILALILSIIIAKLFGTSRTIEIYFAASVILYNIDRFFSLGSITEIYIPKYIRIRDTNSQTEAMNFFSTILGVFLIIGFIISLILFFLSRSFVELILIGFEDKDIDLVSFYFKLLIIFLPIKLFNGLSVIPFRANEKYNIHEKIGIYLKLLSIILLLVFPNKYGLNILFGVMILTVVVKFIYILLLFKKNKFIIKFDFFQNKYLNLKLIKSISVCIFESIAYIFSYLLILSALSGMTQGILAIYQYVSQLYGNIFTIISNSLNTIFLTEVSKKINNSKKVVEQFLIKILFVSFFVLIFGLNCSEQFLNIIWSSERFDQNSIKIAYYLLCLNFITMIITLTDTFYQKFNISKNLYVYQLLGKNFILLISSFVILINLEMGIKIIIIVGLVKATISLLYSLFLSKIKNKNEFIFYNYIELGKYFLLSFVSTWLVYYLFFNLIIIDNVFLNLFSRILVTVILIFLINSVIRIFNFKKLLN